ncbi:MAG: glycosyltransferase [Candidatus Parcubacteria bacterium]|nr:glycosyltransferase [Candidatus Parcubacteria bacterium]
MRVTFIATVFNEENNIDKLLYSLINQSHEPDEIIIVDGGSRDKTMSIISDFKFSIPKSKVKIILKKGNRSIGRNEAVRQATGDIIVCSDAGCVLDKNWIKNIVEQFNDPKTDVVSGYYKAKTENFFEKCIVPYFLVMEDKINANDFLPATRSMAFRKSIWKKVGGFDEKLSNNEDYVFARNLKKIKAKIVFQRDAIVHWLPKKNIKEALAAFYRFSLGDAESHIFRPKVFLIFLRYFIAICLLFYSLKILLILITFYLFWAIYKNYKYVNDWRAFCFLPIIQIISDLAVMVGTTVGLHLSPLFVGILFFLCLHIPLSNLSFNYRDEGYLLNNAQRIISGESPYRDFSLALTPGSFYIQAFVMKVFGNYIMADRIIYIFCTIILLTLSSRLFKFSSYLSYISLMSLGIIFSGKQAFASYNIEGLVFILISFLLFNKLRNNDNFHFYALLIGIMNSIVFMIKQSYGSMFFFALLILIVFFTHYKYLAKNLIFYIVGSLILPGIFFLLFYLNGGLDELIYSVFYFASSVKNDRMPFILTSLLFIPFLLFAVSFVREISVKKVISVALFFVLFFCLYIFIAPSRMHYLSTFYKDPSIYYFLLFFIAPVILIRLFFKSKRESKRYVVITSIVALSLFLSSAFSGRDYTTVIVTAPLYIPLFLYSFLIAHKKTKLPLNNFIATLLLIIYVLPSIFYLINTYGKLYGVGYRKEIYANIKIREAKHIKILVDQKNDLESLINYIKNRTSTSDKLLCIPYCSFLNYLSKRNNASYFGFFYKFKESDQVRVISDLNKNKNSIVVIQKPGSIEKEANYEDKSINIIKSFVNNNYKLVKVTQNFYIYR